MGRDVTLRDGTPNDLPRLLAIVAECPEAASWADTSPAVIAELEGTIVGFVLYRVVAGEGEILNLAILPDYRRRGIASQLITSVLEQAPIWHLEVRASNLAAITLYQQFRFQIAGRRDNYYRDGESALLYQRAEQQT